MDTVRVVGLAVSGAGAQVGVGMAWMLFGEHSEATRGHGLGLECLQRPSGVYLGRDDAAQVFLDKQFLHRAVTKQQADGGARR